MLSDIIPAKRIIPQIVLRPKPNTQGLGYSLFRWCNHSVSPFAIHPSSTVKVDARHGQKSSCQSDAIGAGLQEETLDSCWLWSGSSQLESYHPPANGCTREFDSLVFNEFDSKNYLGSQPWPANTSNSNFSWKSTFNPLAIRVIGMLRSQGGRIGTGHRRVHCQTRPKHKNRGTVSKLEVVFFWRGVNLQGRKRFFFGRRSGWTCIYIYIYIYFFIYRYVCIIFRCFKLPVWCCVFSLYILKFLHLDPVAERMVWVLQPLL